MHVDLDGYLEFVQKKNNITIAANGWICITVAHLTVYRGTLWETALFSQ